MMTKIRSCPFCGYKGALLRSDYSGFYVYCESCSTYGPRKNNAQAAIDQWNYWHCEAQILMFKEMEFSEDQVCEYTRRLINQDGTHTKIAKEVLQNFLKCKPDFSMDKIISEVEAGIAKRKAQKAESTNPSHYSRWKIQPLDFISANNLDFLRGNIIKYIMRYDAKGGLEDLKKARMYLERLIEKAEKDNE